MHAGVERILTLGFGKDQNESCYLGGGWSAAEQGHRWMTGQASEVWLEHPGAGHDLVLEIDVQPFLHPPDLTAQRLLVGVRNASIAQIAVTEPGTLGFHIPAPLVAAPGPVRLLFIHPDFRRPADLGSAADDRQLSLSVRDFRLFRVLSRAASPDQVPDEQKPPPDRMIARFESLGDNCEFGLVQRRLGAEPLGLLRFAFIELPALLSGLRTGFARLGDPGTVEITVDGKDGEFVVREKTHGMTYHTFLYQDRIDVETVREQQVARLRFLRRKLAEDVAAGEKIFVIKRASPLRPEEVLPLYTVLNERGVNWLLWMVPADAAHPSGTVDVLLPGLLRGYVDRFAPYDNAPDLSLAAWTAVCEAACLAAGRTGGLAVRPGGSG